jgi:hypothetical protein
MAIVDRNVLKNWFKRGDKPLASQFSDWIDSFWHKSESIPAMMIDGLQEAIDEKTDRPDFEAHLNDYENPHHVSAGQVGAVTEEEFEELKSEVEVLKSITVIRGNVDAYADNMGDPLLSTLLEIDTANMRVGDSYIVETDETHDGKSTIWTWDGTVWNYTHEWAVSASFNPAPRVQNLTSDMLPSGADAVLDFSSYDVINLVSQAVAETNFSMDFDGVPAGTEKVFNVSIGAYSTNKVILVPPSGATLVAGASYTLESGIWCVTVLWMGTGSSWTKINIAGYA